MTLYKQAKELIPTGSNLFSKRGDLYAPGLWPQYYKSAKGATITAIDCRRDYLDFCGAGVGAAVLGWADPDVDEAVIKAIRSGSTSALLGTEEIELARMLTTLHPWADCARFTRSGGEAMAVAVKIARAHTGRQLVLTGGYHGWHFNDPTHNNLPIGPDAQYLKAKPIDRKVAAVIVEPARLYDPPTGYLESLRTQCDDAGAVLIFDEISSGFRRNLGGVHLQFGINPDIVVFSKAISNGYPMAAVLGTHNVMKVANHTFISSTTWSERIGPVAAQSTIYKMWSLPDLYEHLDYIGNLVRNTILWESKKADLGIQVVGPPQMLHIQFPHMEMQTKYTQLMLEHDILATADFYPTYAHTLEHCEKFKQAAEIIFPKLIEPLTGPVGESGVKR